MPLKLPSIVLTGALGLPAPLGPLPKTPVLVPEPVIINIPFVGEIALAKPMEHPDYWPMPPAKAPPEPEPPTQLRLPVAFPLRAQTPDVVPAAAKEAAMPESGHLIVPVERVAAARKALGVREEGQKPSEKDLQAAFDGTKAPARQQEAVDARPTEPEETGESSDSRGKPGDPEFFTLPENDLFKDIYGELDGDLGPGTLR